MRISAKSWTAFCRDRIAPNCTIRHPVRPIVALQRRMRFSARLAGFCRDRCHQRRARRAELGSFSAFVSNPNFRVPRLRQIGWRAADRAVRRRKRGHSRDQNRGRGYRGVAALARSGPVAARASFMSIFAQDLDPGLRPVLPPLSVGEMTLRLYGALSYSQNSARDLRCALNGA